MRENTLSPLQCCVISKGVWGSKTDLVSAWSLHQLLYIKVLCFRFIQRKKVSTHDMTISTITTNTLSLFDPRIYKKIYVLKKKKKHCVISVTCFSSGYKPMPHIEIQKVFTLLCSLCTSSVQILKISFKSTGIEWNFCLWVSSYIWQDDIKAFVCLSVCLSCNRRKWRSKLPSIIQLDWCVVLLNEP